MGAAKALDAKPPSVNEPNWRRQILIKKEFNRRVTGGIVLP
jgi:hypothetical protein